MKHGHSAGKPGMGGSKAATSRLAPKTEIAKAVHDARHAKRRHGRKK